MLPMIPGIAPGIAPGTDTFAEFEAQYRDKLHEYVALRREREACLCLIQSGAHGICDTCHGRHMRCECSKCYHRTEGIPQFSKLTIR